MTQRDLVKLGKAVEMARLRRGESKEGAARNIGVSSITLKRVEDGKKVRDDIRAKVLTYYGLPLREEPSLGVAPAKVERVRVVIETADLPDDLRRDLLERLDRDARTPTPAPRPPVKPRATGTEGR